MASEGLWGASVRDRRWALSPYHRAIGLRAFASRKSKLPTQPESPRQVCENREMAICPRKSKSRSFQWPEGGGAGDGEEERKSDNSTGQERRGRRRGYRGLLLLPGSGLGCLPEERCCRCRRGRKPSYLSPCRWGLPQQLLRSTVVSPPKFTCGSVLIPSSRRGAGCAALGSLPPRGSGTREVCALFLPRVVCECV